MANCERMIHAGELGKVLAREPDIDRGPVRTGGPTGRTAEIRSHSQPPARLRRPRPCREDLHETWQNVLGGIGGAESIGEPGEHLVGGSSLPVDEPVGQAPGPPADRLEGKDDDDGRGERRDAAALATDNGPHDDDDREIHGVTSTTTAPNTTVFLITMSRSSTRYFKIAMPDATGIPMRMRRKKEGNTRLPRSTPAKTEAIPMRGTAAVAAATYASHRSC